MKREGGGAGKVGIEVLSDAFEGLAVVSAEGTLSTFESEFNHSETSGKSSRRVSAGYEQEVRMSILYFG